MDYATPCECYLIFGIDFMIPSRIRLDLFIATSKLPDEIVVPLLKSARDVDESTHADAVIGGPTESMDIESRLFLKSINSKRNILKRRPKSFGFADYQLWYRR